MAKNIKNKTLVSELIKNSGISNKALATILGVIAVTGGSYAGYTIYKDNMRTDALDMAPVYMSRVIDGDTFILETGEIIRLSEINSPEFGECYSETSKQELEMLLRGQPLRLIKDIQGEDNYKRLIRYAIIDTQEPRLDNILVNKYMIEKGFAKYSANDNQLYQNMLVTAESKARSGRVGLWRDCKNATSDDNSKTRDIEASDPPTDPKCLIKGNISDDIKTGKKYTFPGCPSYSVTKIDKRKGEKYFCTEKEAIKEGFSRNESCQSIGK